MSVRKFKVGPRSEAGQVDHDIEVLEAIVVAPQMTIDTIVARLAVDGVEVVRSSPFYNDVRSGGLSRIGEHKLVFKATDKGAVGDALRTAGLL
jgi:hypothetical protein